MLAPNFDPEKPSLNFLRIFFEKFAGPPAQGVSEPGHQFPVPVHCSLRVLDSTPGVQGTPFMVSLGGGDGAGNLPPQPVESILGKVQKKVSKLVSFWIDFGNQHGSNLAPKIDQKRSQIDAKLPSHVDLILFCIFKLLLLPTWVPRIRQIMVFPKEKPCFFQKSISHDNLVLESF